MNLLFRYIAKISIGLSVIFISSQTLSVDENDGLSVLTGTQATYSITYALLENTSIETINIPEDGRRLNSLKDYIERRKDRFEPIFKAADAVVAYTNVLGSDPLYRFSREANIHLVYIDAAQPWSYDSPGVSLIVEPTTNVSWSSKEHDETHSDGDSSYFWLSINNAIRMSDIIGSDLARIFPEQSETITQNMNRLKADFLSLSREYQNKLFDVLDISVFALANEFVYLTNDMGLFVDGYFLKQDIDWTEPDLKNLTEHLKSRDLKVVLHKWEPSDVIQKAVMDAGAKIIVLDTADPGMSEDRALVAEGYQRILRKNFEQILKGFQ